MFESMILFDVFDSRAKLAILESGKYLINFVWIMTIFEISTYERSETAYLSTLLLVNSMFYSTAISYYRDAIRYWILFDKADYID